MFCVGTAYNLLLSWSSSELKSAIGLTNIVLLKNVWVGASRFNAFAQFSGVFATSR